MEGQRIFIGELSKATGVPVKTIRFYEELRILKRPRRTETAYRLYSQGDVDKLLFIKKAKELGLTLADIRRILGRSRQGMVPTCCLVRELFNQKIEEYELKIREMTLLKKRLEEKLQSWIGPGEAKKMEFIICPQIDADKGIKKKNRNKTGIGGRK